MIEAAGATPHAVAVAIDRQEKATEDGQDVDHSAVQYVRETLGLQVVTIAQLDDVIHYLQAGAMPDATQHLARVQAYRSRYGAP
jgi:orotate phosphoribosyltransferase